MKNVKIEVSSNRKSGATTCAQLLEDYLARLGLTVIRTGDTIVVSGEVPAPEPIKAMCAEALKPVSILAEAHNVIYGDREATYGDPGKNLRTIAAYWDVHLSAAKSIDIRLTPDDVCGMMILLKQARLANSPSHRDSLVDLAGYAALQDRVQNKL